MLSSSHLKITCHLHMWKGHYCYGIIYKLRLLQQKNIYINVKWCDLFHWCLYNKKIMEHYMATWRYKNLKFLCGKIFHSFVFQHSKGDFVLISRLPYIIRFYMYILCILIFSFICHDCSHCTLLLIDRMYCCTSCWCPRQLILLTVNTETWCGKLEIV